MHSSMTFFEINCNLLGFQDSFALMVLEGGCIDDDDDDNIRILTKDMPRAVSL